MSNELLAELQKTNRMLNVLLSVVVDRHIRESDLAKPRPRSIDRMLSDNGLTNTEIATLLGKTPQAVGQQLNADKRVSKANAKEPTIKQEEVAR
jgi:hypothetical protein